MSVNLVKGQKVELKKTNGGVLRKVVVGLGWDEMQKKGFFASFKKAHPIDCDASAIICRNGKLVNDSDIVYFGNLKHKTGSVIHMGDNLTGAGDGDDEQITVDLEKLPSNCDKVIFVVNIYMSSERNQHFGMISNAFIRIFDAETNQELCKYNLTEDYSGMTGMIFGEMCRCNNIWQFNAIGQGTHDNDIRSLAKRFR
ncbi:MAG: TerD family protein [Ruminococcus sp.]|nr:TerD family protein [Ruminococcus sp.]